MDDGPARQTESECRSKRVRACVSEWAWVGRTDGRELGRGEVQRTVGDDWRMSGKTGAGAGGRADDGRLLESRRRFVSVA